MSDGDLSALAGDDLVRALFAEVRAAVGKPAPLLVTREEAADMLGMSLRHFQRHAQPRIRLVRSGSRRLVPISELRGWVTENMDR